MKPKSLLFAFIPLFLVCSFFACNKHDKQATPTDPDAALIQEAKDYFEKEVLPDTLPKSPTVESNRLQIDKVTKWDKANIQDLRWGKTVVVPLNLPNSYVTTDDGGTKKNISRTSFLVIYTDKDKKKRADVVFMLPDEKSTDDSFSGMIIVENWNGEIIESYKFENGYEYKVTTTVLDKTQRDPKTEDVCIDTDWYTCTYYGGSLIGCNYTRTTSQCGSCCGGGTCGRGGCWPAPRDPGTVDPSPPSYESVGGGGTSASFVMSKEDQQKYPRLTQMVKGLATYVKDNPNVLNALLSFSGLTKEQILEKVQFGKGPQIKISDDIEGFGLFSQNNPDELLLNGAYVRGLEQAVLDGTQQATSFLLAVTTLHEFVHWSRFFSGLPSTGLKGVEMGLEFERSAYKAVISEQNAGKYALQFYKN